MNIENSSVIEPTGNGARRPRSYRWLFVSATVVAVALAIVYLLTTRTPGPREGAVYIRAGLDSARVAPLVLGDSVAGASPLARRLVLHLLTRDVRVQVDHVGRCGDLMGRYAAFNASLRRSTRDPLEAEFRTRRPVMLAGSERDQCFSYTVKYDVPLGRPMRRGSSLLTQVPVRLALIHPVADFQQFQKE